MAMPENVRGRPVIDTGRCPDGCRACADACPTDAILVDGGPGSARIDLGRCVFCRDCVEGCPEGAITYGRDHRMASRTREDLALSEGVKLAAALERKMLKLLGRSLKLRHVSAGDCSACTAELQALGNVVFDLARFGVQFVASPRHADGLVVTGPVTQNMRLALEKTWKAVASPRLVIAVGACAISGGPFRGLSAVHDGVESVVPVDLFVPGCPPHPLTLLDGLLRLLGRIEDSPR
ncbi:MAG TPA: NADH-quinone oxidoreductase subunit NuoB [Candidatus Polarisedimenticolia bacterium]|nr:NADH-quinone oxidoreductase subunit NuoB [Candidatus Polarisedimenticolia bacterium]